MRVMGIETSCDETAVAIYDSARGLLAHRLYSQIALHARYGGVVPELASRDHAQQIVPLIQTVLKESQTELSELTGIAYTAGPGLHGALLVGAMLGRSLGFALNIPTVAIHHMEGHLLAPMLEPNPPSFPFVALLVSGGHTLLVRVEGVGQYHVLGESVDDAAGEAFDKVARLLRLPYPGGPSVARCAKKGDPKRFAFPKPMTDRPGCDFSFSGLKTAVKNAWQQSTQDEQTKADIACAFEQAVVSTLILKCHRALQKTGFSTLVLAGGVSANEQLRAQMQCFGESNGIRVVVASPEFCTDNAAMIAYAGYCRLQAGQIDLLQVFVHPRWSLETI